jgi:hypothetical protein
MVSGVGVWVVRGCIPVLMAISTLVMDRLQAARNRDASRNGPLMTTERAGDADVPLIGCASPCFVHWLTRFLKGASLLYD